MTEHVFRPMPLEEFVDEGYLQEVNRRFLHPLGMALSYATAGEKIVRISVIYTDDPEGIIFGSTLTDKDRARGKKIEQIFDEAFMRRTNALGYGVEPL